MPDYPWGDAIWHRRLAMAASLIPPGSRVADIGAGKRDLERYLHAGCAYWSYDKEPCDAGMERFDIETDHFCLLPVHQESQPHVVALLGVLEYLHNPVLALERMRDVAPWLVCSMRRNAPSKHPEAPPRPNTLKIADMPTALENAGWLVLDERTLWEDSAGPVERVYWCRRRETG